MNFPSAPVGAAVHYVNAQGICRAATVTVSEDAISEYRDLRVHHQAEIADRRAVRFGGRAEPGTWHTFDASTELGCRYQS
jgi:hypothetical protein